MRTNEPVDTERTFASIRPITFMRSPGAIYSFFEAGPVRYGMSTLVDIHEGRETSLVAKVGDNFRRVGRWAFVSREHDIAHARRLIRQHHSELLKLAAPKAKA